MDKEYIPYGEEWEKEMMKFPKKFLIGLVKKANQENRTPKEKVELDEGAVEQLMSKYFMIEAPSEEQKIMTIEVDKYYELITRICSTFKPKELIVEKIKWTCEDVILSRKYYTKTQKEIIHSDSRLIAQAIVRKINERN